MHNFRVLLYTTLLFYRSMDTKRLTELAEKFEQGECSTAERLELEQLYLELMIPNSEPADEQEYEQVTADALKHIKQELGIQPKRGIVEKLKPYAVAAALLFSLAIGYYLILIPVKNTKPTFTVKNQDVPPGGNKAYLTLANGQRIALDDSSNGQIARQAGISITKTKDGELVYNPSSNTPSRGANEYNTIVTPKGGQYIVQLPDGSKVWLNAATRLTYSAALNEHGIRRVKLVGEAYFEVAKDQNRPFIVETANQEVQVLGTHFNINAYEDEPSTVTTLLEGSVKIQSLSKKLKSETLLKPGQEAIHHQDEKISVQAADPYYAVAWKDGMIRFQDADFKAIMRQISRWYDIEIVYKEPIHYENLTGAITRKSNLSKFLAILKINDVHFTLTEGPIKKLIIEN